MSSTLPALRSNLVQLLHLVLDAAPSTVVSTDRYVAIRRTFSRTPERFTPPREGSPPRRGEWQPRKIAGPGIDLVVEGFPGSANSYLSNSLRAALPAGVRVVSHFHYTVQIKRALALGLPVVVLVRDPRGACSSYKSKQPQLWSWPIVLRWLLYHRYVWRQLQRLDVIFFDEIIGDLGAVVRRSSRLQGLLGGHPVRGDVSLRRASVRHVQISNDGPVSSRLLRRADRLYARIRAEAGLRGCRIRRPYADRPPPPASG